MIIREAKPEDAEALIAHVNRMANEPNKMVAVNAGEFNLTVEQEQEILSTYAKSDNSIYLVAEIEGRLVGVLNCTGSNRGTKRHTASLGISLALEWRNQGIGTALMSHLIEWAKGTGILTRLELEVYDHNLPAIHLYRKFGFVEEGRRRKAYFQ